MAVHLAAMMKAIESPDHCEPDRRAGRERYFHRGGSLAWIRFVTQFSGDVDLVVTAYPQSNDPRTSASRR